MTDQLPNSWAILSDATLREKLSRREADVQLLVQLGEDTSVL
eukprot:SAG31_NODE_12521_length_921_cov_1.430622_2_plen_41_part_01